MVINALKMNCFTGNVINQEMLTKSFTFIALYQNFYFPESPRCVFMKTTRPFEHFKIENFTITLVLFLVVQEQYIFQADTTHIFFVQEISEIEIWLKNDCFISELQLLFKTLYVFSNVLI